MIVHKLLEQQIKQHLEPGCMNQEQVKLFIAAVNESYHSFQAAIGDAVCSPNGNGYSKLIDPVIEYPDSKKHFLTVVCAGEVNRTEQHPGNEKSEQDLREAEEHLSAANNRLSQLITNLPNGILLEDENGDIVLTNQLFCDMFHLPVSPDIMIGSGSVHSERQPNKLFKDPRAFINRVNWLLENRQLAIGDELEMADGRILARDFIPIYVGIEYKGHLWKYVDITAQKKTGHELKRLSLVASANEDGVAFCDGSGTINWTNEGFTQLTGYLVEEVMGKKMVELCIGPLSDPEAINKMLESFYAGKGFKVELIYYRKDSTWFWGRLKGQSILDEQGVVKQYFLMIEDITQEKEKEEQLRVLSLIAEDNNNGVVISDAEGCISWVNKSFVAITGYTLAEVKGKRPGMMRGPDTNPDTMAYMGQQIAAGKSFSCELLNYKKGGEKYWLRIQVQAIRNKKGELTGFFTLEEDITKEKKGQEKLKEYESRFRKAFEKIGDNVWEHDFSTGKTYFSNTKDHVLGYSLEEFTSNANLWWDRTYNDDRILLDQNDSRYRRGEIDHHILEYRIVHKDGSIRWVMDRGVVIEHTRDNKPLKIIGTHTDITERKQAEELLQREEQKYRSIIANMNLGLLEVDTEENVVFTNQSFCEMSGYEYEELIGRRASHIYVKEETIELIERKNEARKRASLHAYEIAVKNKIGQLRWWLISGAPRYNDAGELVGSIGIHLDITDQKQLEIDLIEAREQAEESTRSKEVFLANMSHEIRTPMNAILGMTNQLSKTKLDSKQLFYLDTINSASENLLVIINDILDLSKIEAGKLNLECIGFDARSVLNRAMQVMMHRAEEKGLSITNSVCDKDLSPVLLGDPYRLNQVLLNLISNAIKFTEKGCVDLSCTVLEDTALSQLILIEVIDTGIGMDELFVTNLFEKFSQEDVSVTRQYGGTGLGMSICKDLIELMGGDITVQSKKEHGTSVAIKVEFPKGTMHDLPFKEEFHINKDMLANKIILVVDDNNMNRLVAKTILNNFGAITLEAVNGREAIDLLKQQEIDLVLMDIQMPVMGGMEATRIIRKEVSDSLPIVALTANAIKGDNEKCLDGGMNAYLSKPFKEEDLLHIVSFWLGGPSRQCPQVKRPTVKALPEKLYNLSSIRAISRGNEIFVVKMVNMFIMQTPAQVAEMENRLNRGDYKGMSVIAHKIRPSIDNMGIVSLKQAIRKIEKLGKIGIADDEFKSLVHMVSTTIADVVSTLQKEFEITVE